MAPITACGCPFEKVGRPSVGSLNFCTLSGGAMSTHSEGELRRIVSPVTVHSSEPLIIGCGSGSCKGSMHGWSTSTTIWRGGEVLVDSATKARSCIVSRASATALEIRSRDACDSNDENSGPT